MTDSLIGAALQNLNVDGFVTESAEKTLARHIAFRMARAIEQQSPERLPRIAFAYEIEGTARYRRWVALGVVDRATQRDIDAADEARQDHQRCFTSAFFCWRALLNAGPGASGVTDPVVALLDSELGIEPIPAPLKLAFHLAVTGLLAGRSAEVRLELGRLELGSGAYAGDWSATVISHLVEAFTLLVRKGGGWRDISTAIERIADLRRLQNDYEEEYIDTHGDGQRKVEAALTLVGLYHMAQMVSATGEYLQAGTPGLDALNLQVARHCDRATEAFQVSGDSGMVHLATLLSLGCRELAHNSIWTHYIRLPRPVKGYIDLLVDRGRSNPILELWPAQQQALLRNVLSTYHRAILVGMPTSAGKTLLAKFAIIQALALNPGTKVAYVVPTRALANQVTIDLRTDFANLRPRIRVEQTVPAFELDPTEDQLLQAAPDVLVTTPEKLDLLIRKDHPCVHDVSLVVVDEAHNIGEKGKSARGARLELLLGTLKRERPGVRFMLLSPFLPENDELLAWLGERESLPAITVDWRPGNRVVGAVKALGGRTRPGIWFETLPAADNSDIRSTIEVPLASVDLIGDANPTIAVLTKATVEAMRSRGAVLVLCRGKGTANKRARELAEALPQVEYGPEVAAVANFLHAELGHRGSIVDSLRRGVACHHAGISHEARWLIECLMKERHIDVICGTTTLGQGMNFPISTVVVEDLRKGTDRLSPEDFWNIAGRAGRTLMDTVGIVAFPVTNRRTRDSRAQFLQAEAEVLASQLASLIDRADDIAQNFNMAAVARNPGLSALLQFLAHALRVAGRRDIADEVEDIMRASLVYHQLRRRDERAADRLLRLCRAYLQQLQGEQHLESLLGTADQTGFSTPSVKRLLAGAAQDRGMRSLAEWQPAALFGADLEPLAKRIEIIGELPEIELGSGDMPAFNPERIAGILRGWVQGLPLRDLADRYWHENQGDGVDDRIAGFSSYLFSSLIGKASWGLGALEGICLPHGAEQAGDAGYVPSMVFYGVNSKEAVWFRMVGVPRVLAHGLASMWRTDGRGEPGSYDDLRAWVSHLGARGWQGAVPAGSPLTPQDCAVLWKMANGG